MGKVVLHKSFLHIILIVLLSLFAYSNTFKVPFHYDDKHVIVKNPIIKNLQYFIEPSETEDFQRHFEYKTFKHRYIGYLTFALNYKLHGLDVTGYHVVNLLIHIINALLVYILIIVSFKTPYLRNSGIKDYSGLIALSTSLLFACHPIQTMAVTYIWQRVASLATLFYVLSLVSYIKYRLCILKPGSNHRGCSNIKFSYFYLISILSAILAMKTKEMAFTLPVMIALYEFMFFDGKIKTRVLYLIPLLLTVLIIPLSLLGIDKPIGEIIGGVSEATRFLSTLPRLDYLCTEFRVILTYIRLLFFPMNQIVDYDYSIYSSLFNIEVLTSFLFLSFLSGFGVYLFYRYRHTAPYTRLISYGIFWFFITLSVESSIIPLIRVIDEYRMYLSSIGFLTAINTFLFLLVIKFKDRWKSIDTAVITTLAIIAVILTGLTYSRNSVWKNEISLWEDTVSKSPEYTEAHTSLGNAYMHQGLVDKAFKQYLIAIKLDPNSILANFNLGKAYEIKGQMNAAIQQYQKVIILNPAYANAHNSLGSAYKYKGFIEEAIKEFEFTIKIDPSNSKAHNNLGNIYYSKGLIEKAIKHYQIAIKINPDLSGTYNNLASAYKSKGLNNKAQELYQSVIKLYPTDSDSFNNIGIAYFEKGSIDVAISHFKSAIEINPDHADAHYNLGIAYGEKGLLDLANSEMRKGIRLKRNR